MLYALSVGLHVAWLWDKWEFLNILVAWSPKTKQKQENNPLMYYKDLFQGKQTNDQVIKNRISVTSSLAERNPDWVIH